MVTQRANTALHTPVTGGTHFCQEVIHHHVSLILSLAPKMMGIKGKEGNHIQGSMAVPLASEVKKGTACVINIISYTCTYLHNKKNTEKFIPYSMQRNKC